MLFASSLGEAWCLYKASKSLCGLYLVEELSSNLSPCLFVENKIRSKIPRHNGCTVR